jgi:glycosyltransferase involved in cell wall biosynthesis
MPTLDAFVDFSGVPSDVPLSTAMERLASPEFLGCFAGQVRCALPSDPATMRTRPPGAWRVTRTGPVKSCNLAMAAAACTGHPLLILLGDVEPESEALGLLLEAIDTDPMIGFALPRLRGSSDASLARLDVSGDPAIVELPRRVLSEFPDTYLVADAPARCLLIKPMVLANFAELDERFRSVAGALWHYVGAARRCGFRTLVCNRAVVSAGDAARGLYPACVITLGSLPEADRVRLGELLPDAARAREEFGTGAIAPAETRLARALPEAYGTRPSLLLDVRNVGSGMNGTAMAALGICSGLRAPCAGWDVTLLASREACASHELEDQFPDWEVTAKRPDRQFTAALRLSQPWHISEMVDLHCAAAYNVYLFLDTIAWDIIYPAPRHLDGTWRFLADHADGLLFISEFSRERFQRRFPAGASVPWLVPYLSFDPVDYLRRDVRPAPDPEGYIFIVGNAYDHKDVSPTIDLLSTAFPYQRIVALGPATATTPRVTLLESGTLSDLDMHRLYAGARLVVFSSFYEGFGLPIVTALAYGRTLLARRSTLLEEIAARCAPRGRIVPFDRREDLVTLIGRLLHGEEVSGLPLGAALENGRPGSWQDVGKTVMSFLATLVGDLSRSRWRDRDHAIQQLMAAPTSLMEQGLK